MSNYDAFIMSNQVIAHMMLTDYFNSGELVLFEIVAKHGHPEGRAKSIYFTRFVMIIANYLVKNLFITQPDNKLDCWVQSKRVCGDLLRILANDEVPLTLPSLMQVQTSNPSSSSNPQISSVGSAVMEVAHP